MRQRSDEAARLESDYMARLEQALSVLSLQERLEIQQNVRGHVEEALAESGHLEVTLTEMARVLEELGPPSTFVSGAKAAGGSSEGKEPTRGGPDPGSHLMMLEKVWIAELIACLGLYIPVIDFHFCYLAGAIMFLVVMHRHQQDPISEFQGMFRQTRIVVALYLGAFLTGLVTLAAPLAGLISAPLAIAYVVMATYVWWKMLGGVSRLLLVHGLRNTSDQILIWRKNYIIASIIVFVIALCVGVAIAATKSTQSESVVIELALLPLTWILGYLYSLRPISLAREALEKKGTA